MNFLAGSLLVALISVAGAYQSPAENLGPKSAPDLEVVKLEISVRRSANADASPVPRADMGSVAQRQVDQNVSGPPQDSMGIRNDLPSGGTAPKNPSPNSGSTNRGMDRLPTDSTTPHYDNYGNVVRGSDAYWPQDAEANNSEYEFFASLTVKNTGQKPIKGFHWDYVLTNGGTGKEVARHHFHAKKALKPADSITVVEVVKPSGARRRIEITRVEYADGSSWQPEAAAKGQKQIKTE
jgi:hypothetical protein